MAQPAEKSRYKSELKRADDYDDRHHRRYRHRSRSKSSHSRSDRIQQHHHRKRSRSKSAARRSRSYTGSHSRRRGHRNRSRSSSRSRSHRRRHRSRSRSSSRDYRRSHKSRSKSIQHERRSRSRSKDDATEQKQFEHVIERPQQATSSRSSTTAESSLHQIRAPSPPIISRRNQQTNNGAYCNLDVDEPIDKEKIHKDIEEKLRLALAREGKVYPPPKPEASHPVFANDGSFLELFKKMQQQSVGGGSSHQSQDDEGNSFPMPMPTTTSKPTASTSAVPVPQIPVFGRRRGGKILKTGVVAKPKAQNEADGSDPKDFWTLYLREVNKYKNAACESDGQTRPLVK